MKVYLIKARDQTVVFSKHVPIHLADMPLLAPGARLLRPSTWVLYYLVLYLNKKSDCFIIYKILIIFTFGLLADYVKTCYKNQPGFINCSTHAVQFLFNEIPKGEPAIGLEPLDPLYVPRIKVSTENIMNIFIFIFSNVIIRNLIFYRIKFSVVI